MEGVSNNVVRPNYKATKKGAVTGAAIGVGSTLAAAGLMKCCYSNLPKNHTFAQGREWVKTMQNVMPKVEGVKTAVSKQVKTALKSTLSIGNFARVAVITGVLGAAIGLAVDLVKNKKAEKSQV